MRGYLRIDLASNCNIRCIMCQAYNGVSRAQMHFFDFETFARQTKGQLRDWQCIQLGNVAEATIHPEFGKFVEYIRSESDALIHIVTNGSILDRYADLINGAANCLVQLSMDSLRKDVHEYIRFGSNFDRVLRNLGLIDVRRTKVLLSFTMMRSNIDEYEDWVSLCRDRGYSMSCFPMIVRTENGVIPSNLVEECLWFSLDKLKTWLMKFYGTAYGGVVEGSGVLGTTLDEFTCDKHFEDLGLDAYGNATLCFKVSLGNLGRQPLNELWENETAEAFRRQVEQDRGPCFSCDYRQRCLAPSLALLENHFSEEIVAALSGETRRIIGYDRTLSDDEAKEMFVDDASRTFGIFKIERRGQGYVAERLHTLRPKPPASGEPSGSGAVIAATREQLHGLMREAVDSPFDVILVEQYRGHNIVRYLRRHWGLPLALGFVNLTREADRLKPGVISAATAEELKRQIDGTSTVGVVMLLESYRGYNLVAYLGRHWALPVVLGHVDLTRHRDRSQPGILVAHSLEDVKAKVDGATGLARPVPQLLATRSGHSIVAYLGRYWGLPLVLGDVDLTQHRERSRSGILVAQSPEAIQLGIEHRSSRAPAR